MQFNFVAILILLVIIPSTFALTASIGNSRMVLRLDQNEEIERSILVKNVNDVPVTINAFATGDLAKYITLEKESFELSPNDEEKLFFTINAKKSGTTESKINIKFIPEEGNGVGLTSTIIVIAGGNFDSDDNDQDKFFDLEDEEFMEDKLEPINDEEFMEKDSDFTFKPGASKQTQTFKISSGIKTLLVSTITLIIILGILYVATFKKIKPKKRLTKKSA